MKSTLPSSVVLWFRNLGNIVRRTNFKLTSGEKNLFSIWHLHMRTMKNLDLTQIYNKAPINIKKN